MGLPGVIFPGLNLYLPYNTDDYNWFNITAVDVTRWNLDTLHLLPGQQYAFAAEMACF